ncbi:MAG: transcription antitermination factor NusB [Phycisphaerae bacterium]
MTNSLDSTPDISALTIPQRSHARRLALQALFQVDAQGDDFLSAGLAEFIVQSTNDISVRLRAIHMANNAWDYRKVADEWISRLMKEWSLSRIAAVDRAVLRLGLWEMTSERSTPPRIVLDEAINMAGEYSTAESSKFVNGVLGAAYAEFAANITAAESRPDNTSE